MDPAGGLARRGRTSRILSPQFPATPCSMTVETPLAPPTWSLRRLYIVSAAEVEQLADVLIDCVDGGASVSFMAPLSREHALSFWRMVAEDVADGDRALIVAEDAEHVGREAGKSLLVLDTITGSDADRLYAREGWVRVGEVPDYAYMPHGELRGTTFFYRRITSAHHGEYRPGDAVP
jgi:hypothetical protein